MGKNIHVTHRKSGDWAVIGEGDQRASSLSNTQKEAIELARQLAINNKSELVIHRVDNKIRDKDSFGNDSFPPKG
ncbi:MAG: hypothetical protein UT48_C0005G0037 [Parcubacteria group bacterium GW2011_GWE2_39_37]|nr:MAG: hypothetical protein UT48_C0005G0037 [Parcubacteria group bacterium GW2011_GWE2_39_37]